MTDAFGTLLAASLTGAHRHDVTERGALVEAIPPIRGKRGRPRRKPVIVQADLG